MAVSIPKCGYAAALALSAIGTVPVSAADARTIAIDATAPTTQR